MDTKIVNKQGEEMSLAYQLHKVDGDWEVYDVVTTYDVVIENVNLVNDYHA